MSRSITRYIDELKEFDRAIITHERHIKYYQQEIDNPSSNKPDYIITCNNWLKYYQRKLANTFVSKKEFLFTKADYFTPVDNDPEIYGIPDQLTKGEKLRLEQLISHKDEDLGFKDDDIIDIRKQNQKPQLPKVASLTDESDMDRILELRNERRRQATEAQEIIDQLRVEEKQMLDAGVTPLEVNKRINARHRELLNTKYPMKPGHREIVEGTGFLGLSPPKDEDEDPRKKKLAEALNAVQIQLEKLQSDKIANS